MNIKPEDFYLQAASIDELLSEDFETVPGEKSKTDIAALRLAAWCRQSSSGNWELFSKRLERDGLTMSQVLERFSGARLRSSVKLPDWVLNAIEIINHHQNTKNKQVIHNLEIPFFEVFNSTVALGTSKLVSTGSPSKYLSDTALFSIQKILYSQLSELYTPYLYQEFQEFKKDKVSGNHEKYFYDQFIKNYQEESLLALWKKKPVFLRLTSTILSQWIACNREFIERLSQDWEEIETKFIASDRSKNLQLVEIESGISDLHNGGHSVYIAHLSNQQKILYKPKDCRLDFAWDALIQNLNEMNPPIDLRAAKIIQKNGYGWSEFIEDPSCSDLKQIERFFFRAGALLAMFHIFVGTDMHFENILATSEYPVPIDLEMILQGTSPELQTDSPLKKSISLAAHRANNSVLNVGLLPTYIETTDKKIANIGGLNSTSGTKVRQIWSMVNTDQMFVEKKTFAREAPLNIPSFKGKSASLGDFLEHFMTGFSEYMLFIMKVRDQKGVGFFFDEFSELATRKVIKPTRFYHALIQRIKNPAQFDDGIIWSTELDFISRFSDWNKKIDFYWPLLKAERRDLSELNIPIFFNHVKLQQVINPNGLVFQSDLEPGLPRAILRLTNFDNKELQWQNQLIKASTFSYVKYQQHLNINEGTDISNGESLDFCDVLINEVKTISSTLIDLAIADDKGASWLGIDWLGDSNTASRLVPLGHTLYGGNCGIAIFLAAYGRHFKDPEARKYALLSLSGLRSDICDSNAQRFARSIGIGGASGLGSIVYSLTVIGELLEENKLIDDAIVAARLISKELISQDKSLDIIGGSAGAILCLLKLYQQTQENWVLEKAVECGDHLLQTERMMVNGQQSWLSNGFSEKPLNGISHGASGFAYALSYLSKISGLDRFHEAAYECLEYENANYDENYHNWPPSISNNLQGAPLRERLRTCQWCHGGVGVGLARIALASRGLFEKNLIEQDIQRALESYKNNSSNNQDSLCCGRMGHIEFLYEAGKHTKQPDLESNSEHNLIDCIKTAHKHNSYNFNAGGGNGEFHLSLFRGIAGVGYTAMRRLDPKLPNILFFE